MAPPEPDEVAPVHDLDDHAEALAQLAVLAVLLRDQPLIHTGALDVHVEIGQVEVRRARLDHLALPSLEDEGARLVPPLDPEPVEHAGQLALDWMGELRMREVTHAAFYFLASSAKTPGAPGDPGRPVAPVAAARRAPAGSPVGTADQGNGRARNASRVGEATPRRRRPARQTFQHARACSFTCKHPQHSGTRPNQAVSGSPWIRSRSRLEE